eukprot:1611239-Ditylum_brightwellii.AAC.1
MEYEVRISVFLSMATGPLSAILSLTEMCAVMDFSSDKSVSCRVGAAAENFLKCLGAMLAALALNLVVGISQDPSK